MRYSVDRVTSARHDALDAHGVALRMPGQVGVQDEDIGGLFGQRDVVVGEAGVLGGGHGPEVDRLNVRVGPGVPDLAGDGDAADRTVPDREETSEVRPSCETG